MTKKHNFEEALARLEKLVNELEAGEVKLDEMLKKYEEGIELIQFCMSQLDHAEKRIEQLSGNKEDGFKLEPYEG